MHPYPHHYRAVASGSPSDSISTASPGLPVIEAAAPPQFDGPAGLWSPETLLCASIADCFVLTFRAVSRVAKFPWLKLDCRVEGVLDRLDRQLQFVEFKTCVDLHVSAGGDETQGRNLLQKAEETCLVANSLRAKRLLEVQIRSPVVTSGGSP